MLQVEAMLAVHEAVKTQILFDIQRLCYLFIAIDPVIKSVCIFTHKLEYPVLFAIWCNSVYLQKPFIDCLQYSLVPIQTCCFFIPSPVFLSFHVPL